MLKLKFLNITHQPVKCQPCNQGWLGDAAAVCWHEHTHFLHFCIQAQVSDGVNRYVELLAMIDERNPKRAEKRILRLSMGKKGEHVEELVKLCDRE